MGVFSLLFGCAKKEPPLVDGGLYYTQEEDGRYAVLKILKLDDHGVHVRVYSNRFDQPPPSVDPASLFMAGMPKEGEARTDPMGMGHLPMSRGSFDAWGAVFIQQSAVAEDELEGYEMWSEAGGGYF